MKFAILTGLGLQQYELPPSTTIGQLKTGLRSKFSIGASEALSLTYRARYLDDSDSLTKVGIPEGGTLIMLLKLGPN
jgi:hypothetical protein